MNGILLNQTGSTAQITQQLEQLENSKVDKTEFEPVKTKTDALKTTLINGGSNISVSDPIDNGDGTQTYTISTSNDQDTTYSADGTTIVLDENTNTFSLPTGKSNPSVISGATIKVESDDTVIAGINLDTYGRITGITTKTIKLPDVIDGGTF